MFFVELFIPERMRRRLRGGSGSTLIWALIVVLILSLILAAGFTISQRQQNTAITQHIENQAYYTAMSTVSAVVEWLSGTVYSMDADNDYDGDDPKAIFIDWVLQQPADTWIEFEVTTSSGGAFPDTLGSFRLFVKHDDNDFISIKSVADYYGETRTIVGYITNDPSQTITSGGATVAKIDVPSPPEIPMAPDGSGLTDTSGMILLNNSGSPPGGTFSATGEYYMTGYSGNPSITGTMKTLVVKNTARVTFAGKVDMMIIEANATVVIGNGAYIGMLVIEDGGKTEFQSNSKLYGLAGGTSSTSVYVLAGGQFINTAQGNNQSNCIIYAYASSNPNKIAKVQLGKMEVKDIIVQPANTSPPRDPDTGEYEYQPSYSADIGNPATIQMTGKIHLPINYAVGSTIYNMDNWNTLPASILNKVCNPRNTGTRPEEAPYCPHFLALNEPDRITYTDSWSSSGSFHEE